MFFYPDLSQREPAVCRPDEQIGRLFDTGGQSVTQRLGALRNTMKSGGAAHLPESTTAGTRSDVPAAAGCRPAERCHPGS